MKGLEDDVSGRIDADEALDLLVELDEVVTAAKVIALTALRFTRRET
ncbi:MAG: hypothetical protein QGH70_09115 [Nitrospinota bacterium]|jgi:hypothetical protein|nr:hypothetical protein [Nitrospinota bacterium]MDP6483990.1 hypothetical protein [Nitrospinota bacterium]MDP6620516.1 hypothetical protein [Nitrospinota bacterium]MDP7386009.1 hypothetical protein [Nitrospinota bacterium]HJM43465.1 hypothetical protein [Nitrospinota bacterium]